MDFIHQLPGYLWSILLIAVFFGGSIFVHELGHFLAARRRGMIVERFSIGFGPKIFSWKGKDGVEYRLSWLPLGGYVALPQLADMRGIEGESTTDIQRLPPPSYSTKMIVSVAGAVCNIIFAFVLATILWGVGQPVSTEDQTTTIGFVAPTATLPDGTEVTGAAKAAGLLPGDRILLVDGKVVRAFSEIDYLVALGAGRNPDGTPKVELTLDRKGQKLVVPVTPTYSGAEDMRFIGIEPSVNPVIMGVLSGSPAAKAGLLEGDVITHVDDQPASYLSFISEYLRLTGATKPVKLTFLRDGKTASVSLVPQLITEVGASKPVPRLGVSLKGKMNVSIIHVAPWTQIQRHLVSVWRTLTSLINPHSDIGPSKMSGPVGIARIFYLLSQLDIRLVLGFTVFLNVNLALFNLLPIPVLDGGHMLFATINKLRGRSLPATLIATTQSVFMVLLFTMIIYVSFFDVRRINRDIKDERAESAAPRLLAPATSAPAK